MSFKVHGELAPYLFKYPGLFGLYGEVEAWEENGTELSSGCVDGTCDFGIQVDHRCNHSVARPALLPPIDLGTSSNPLFDHYDSSEDTPSSSSDSSETAQSSDEADDWRFGRQSVTTTIQRQRALRIPRKARTSPPSPTGTISRLTHVDTERLDRLVCEVKAVVIRCNDSVAPDLTATTTSQDTETSPIHECLHKLSPYARARATDLLVPASRARFPTGYQIFPAIRPHGHPLRCNPPSGTNQTAQAGLRQSLFQLKPLVQKHKLDELLLSNLAALLATLRIVKHLAAELGCVGEHDGRFASASRTEPVIVNTSSDATAQHPAKQLQTCSGELEVLTEVLVDRLRLKPYQYTVVKKVLEGNGFLPTGPGSA